MPIPATHQSTTIVIIYITTPSIIIIIIVIIIPDIPDGKKQYAPLIMFKLLLGKFIGTGRNNGLDFTVTNNI